LKIILKYFNIDVKGIDSNNNSFITACESGNVEVVKHLLSLGDNHYIDIHSPKHYKYSDMSKALLSTIRNYFLGYDGTLKLLFSLKGDRKVMVDERYIAMCRGKVIRLLTLVLDNVDKRFSRKFYKKIDLYEIRTSVGIHILRIARIRLKESRYDHYIRMNKFRVLKHLKCLPPGGVDYHKLIDKYRQ